MQKDELEKFKQYLNDSGAIIIPSTNPFELVRFKTLNGQNKYTKSIIYINKFGTITSYSSDTAYEAHRKFQEGKPFKAVDRRRNQLTAVKRNLAIRDGKECWFCGVELEKDQLTVEHLLSFSHGGSDNLNNLVLACKPCNKEVGNGSVAQKVLFRERKRSEVNVSIT